LTTKYCIIHYFGVHFFHLNSKARYVKEVEAMEETVKFSQEIYDDNGNLIEVHEKFPLDKGHRKL